MKNVYLFLGAHRTEEDFNLFKQKAMDVMDNITISKTIFLIEYGGPLPEQLNINGFSLYGDIKVKFLQHKEQIQQLVDSRVNTGRWKLDVGGDIFFKLIVDFYSVFSNKITIEDIRFDDYIQFAKAHPLVGYDVMLQLRNSSIANQIKMLFTDSIENIILALGGDHKGIIRLLNDEKTKLNITNY